MKNALLILVLISISLTSYSQGSDLKDFTNNLYLLERQKNFINNGLNFNDTNSYQGTPYNSPNYLIGNIYKDDVLWATDVALRYNAVADEIEVKESLQTDNLEARILPKSPDMYAKIGGNIFIFAPYMGQIEGGGYFQVLYEGEKASLFKKIIKSYRPPKKASTSLTKDVPGLFIDRPKYYLIDQEGRFIEIANSKKKAFNVFGDKNNTVSDYAKENKLDINDEKDLIKLMQYYNAL